VAPDVIAGTPGQEQDELASFAQQEANRMDRIKKRYSSDSAPTSGVNSGMYLYYYNFFFQFNKMSYNWIRET
jgi:hypothetical protein